MDAPTLATLISTLPNLVIAVWVIYTLQKQNALLQDKLSTLIDQLMALHPPADKPDKVSP